MKIIREADLNDLNQLLELYKSLHEKKVPTGKHIENIWSEIIADNNHHVIVVELGNKIVSSCICVIINNLTREGRPYALIENVVTDECFRNQGLASECLKYAFEIATKKKCYKMMLMTGSKKIETRNFYKKLGFNDKDKTAFIRWI